MGILQREASFFLLKLPMQVAIIINTILKWEQEVTSTLQ